MYINTPNRLAQIIKLINELRPDFEQYIVDTNIYLHLRWEAFIAAPSDMKQHYMYPPTFKCLPIDYIMHDGWVHVERHQTMSSAELLEQVVYANYDNAFDEVIDINALKEEILAKNMGSFRYDW